MGTTTLTPGATYQVIAAPGHPTDSTVTVLSVEGRTATAAARYGVERFTLRRNGMWAAAGGDQWSNYLRAAS